MIAWILAAPGRLELVRTERPRPGEGEIVLRVKAALTCGTDLKAYLRGHPKWPTPTRFGHEFAGEVAEVGKGVRGIREGDAVMAAPTGPCDACFWCERGQENLCETLIPEMALGGYAQYVRLPRRVVRKNLFPKPSQLSFAEAALLEPLSCVEFGLGESVVGPDDTAVVLGAGAIGLLHVAALRRRGIGEVWVVARHRWRAEVARRFGASRVFEGNVADVLEAIREHTRGRGADLVIECTGRKEVWEAAPAMARRGGEVILFGGCPGGTQVQFDAARLHYDQVRVRSPFHFTPGAVRRAYEVLAARAFDPGPIFSGRYGLGGLEEALREMEAGRAIKVVIEP
jgi:L-iditol 2-dehydrogenase